MRRIKNYLWGILIALGFLIVGFITLSDYGLNIDEPAHFTRGQAFLRILLTGEKDYKNFNLPRKSAWQSDSYNGYYYLKVPSGHPHLSKILAAASNYMLYQKLGWLGDLESYHFYEIFISSLLVLLVYLMIQQHYGRFAGIVASLSVGLYPLFFGESRFNIKDPIQTSFYAFTLYFLYLGINKLQMRYFLFSSIFFAFALGTKFNILFLPFIIVPYIAVRYFSFLKEIFLKRKVKILVKTFPKIVLILLVYFFISGVIFYFFNPNLWGNPTRFLEYLSYYKGIGLGGSYQPKYLFHGWNFYPPFFIAISTPLVILFFSLIGILVSIFNFHKEKSKFSFLLILWFFVPILRVMWPGTVIYSGVRQIMEYIPAMAGLAGRGAGYMVTLLNGYIVKSKWLKKQFNNLAIEPLKFLKTAVVLMFFPITLKLISLHPNENVYMNPLIGGLKGAVERRVPGAAETMGNVYLQGIWWLNQNAEENARFGLAVGYPSNIPRQFLREDLRLGPFFSGMLHEGEYIMGMKSVDFPPEDYNTYKLQYLRRFLIPVYKVEVEGVSLLTIWKNDKNHTKPEFLEEKEIKDFEILGNKEEGVIDISLKEPESLTRLELDYENKDCVFSKKRERSGIVYYSSDGEEIKILPADLMYFERAYGKRSKVKGFKKVSGRFYYFFPALPIRWTQLAPEEPNSCIFNYRQIRIFGLKNLVP